MKLFVFGSRTVSYLPDEFKSLLLEHCSNCDEIIIGDCYGVDNLVQEFLCSNNYFNVTVYHIKYAPRYYYPKFKRNQVEGFYQVDKDKAMCNDCDEYLCLIQDFSKGSLRNVRQLKRYGKNGVCIDVFSGKIDVLH